jgi:hypothetical protein
MGRANTDRVLSGVSLFDDGKGTMFSIVSARKALDEISGHSIDMYYSILLSVMIYSAY